MADRVDPLMHPMQSPRRQPMMHGSLSKPQAAKLLDLDDSVLASREFGDRIVASTVPLPMGRFPTIYVGFRPVGVHGEQGGGLKRMHGAQFEAISRQLRGNCVHGRSAPRGPPH